MIKSAFLLLLSVAAMGQTQQPPQVISQFLGVNQNDPSVSIGNEAQDALNVESSLNGTALLKRYGYSRTASLAVSTSPATGVYSFIDPNGNKQQIVCQDHNCAKSTNNSAFSVFLSTAGGTCMPTRWQFASISGLIYAVNDCFDVPWRYDGTTRTPIPTAPLGSIIEATKDRLVISGVSSNPSGAYYSQSGTPTNFTTGINSADPYVDSIGAQGDQVRALKYALGRLFLFKTASITSCILGDQYTSKCFPVSNTVGTSDPLAVIEVPGSNTAQGMTSGAILFRGSDTNFWKLDQNGLNPISKKIPNIIASQTSGSNQSNTQTSQADWNAGTQTPSGSWNTTTLSGSIFPSSVTFADNTTAAFSSGTTFTNISTTDFTNAISLSSTVVQDNFSDGDYTSNPTWTLTSGSFAIYQAGGITSCSGMSCYVTSTSDGVNAINTPLSINSGSWSWDYTWTNVGNGSNADCYDYVHAGECFGMHFMKDGSGNYYSVNVVSFDLSTTKTVSIQKNVSGTPTIFTQSNYAFPAKGTTTHFEIQRSTDGRMYLFLAGVFFGSTTVDTAITSPTSIELSANAYNHSPVRIENQFSNIYAYKYSTSGKFVSREFDTSFSTPIWGPLSSTFTVATNNIEGQVDFYTQVSTSPNNDLYDAKVASSDTLKVASAAKRYIRYEADLATFISTKTPTVSAVSLVAATTGQFSTQCVQPGSGISGWGALSCAQTLTGAGSEVFYATSAATCATLPAGAPTSWQTSVTNNATLSISTNAAVYIGWRSLLGSATDQAQVDACTLYWTNGTPTPPSWGAYDPVKNAAYWTAAINNASTANRVLKYDLNLNEWYPFGLNATALYRDANSNALYFGDSSAGYWNKYGGVQSDNGAAINAYWISRDFGNATNPFVDNNYDRISLVTKNQVTGTMTVAYNLSNGDANSYSVSLSTTSGITYVHSNAALTQTSPAEFLNINLGNNSTNGFEIDALQLDLSSWGWSEQNP